MKRPEKTITRRFDALNIEKKRDKLYNCQQVKYTLTFNIGVLRIFLVILNISKDEMIDLYRKGLKTYIWNQVWVEDYSWILEATTEAKRVDALYFYVGMRTSMDELRNSQTDQCPVSIMIRDIFLCNIFPAKRDKSMKKSNFQ